jgi:hypothetical protein
MNKIEKTRNVRVLGKRMIMSAVFMMVLALAMTINVAAEETTGGVSEGWNTLMGVGAITLLAIGGLLFVLPKIFTDMSQGTKKIFTYGAAFFVVAGAFSFLGVGLTAEGGDGGNDPIIVEDWFATLTDDSTDIVWLNEYTANWYIEYNTTSNTIHSSNDSAIFTLNVGRADDSAAWYYDDATVGTVGEVTAPSTGIAYPIIARGSDNLFEADWTTSGADTFNYACTLPASEVRADSANLTIELSDKAFEECTVGQGAAFTISYFDFTWTINVVVESIYTA